MPTSMIGSVRPLHVDDVDGLHTPLDGSKWLKTGTIETDIGSYPDAKTSTPEGVQTGGVFVSSNNTGATNIRDVYWTGDEYLCISDNKNIYGYDSSFIYTGTIVNLTVMSNPFNLIKIANYWYVLDLSQKNIWQFDLNWVHTGTKLDVDILAGFPYGMGFDGQYFLLSYPTSTSVHRFTLAGQYVDEFVDVSTETIHPRGIVFDGYFYWVASRGTSESGDAKVYGYHSDGSYANKVFTSVAGYTYGLAMKEDNILIADSALGNKIHEYTGYVPFVGGQYTGDTFSVVSNPTAIAWDGTYYYVHTISSSSVYKYNSSWTPISNHYIGGTVSNSYGMCWDGTHFWVTDVAGDVYRFTDSWVYDSFSFSTYTQATQPTGIAFDGTFFWVADFTTKNIYKYTSDGTYTSEFIDTSFQISGGSQLYGLTCDGSFLYAINTTTATVYQYNLTGTYTGVNFIIPDVPSLRIGVAFDGSHLLMLSYSGDAVYAYTGFAPYLGIPTAEYDESSNLPIYLKIKD